MSKEKPEAKTKPLYDVRRVHIGKNAYLQELSHECGELYSRTLVLFWRTVRRKGIWLKSKHLMRLFTSPKLHAHTSDACVQAFFASLASWRERRKTDPHAKPPSKRRWYFRIEYKRSAMQLAGGVLRLSNGQGNKPLLLPWPHALPQTVVIRWTGTDYEAIATYKIGDDLSEEEPQDFDQRRTLRTAGIDLGEVHIAVSHDGEHSHILNGRLLRSKRQYHNKLKAKLDSKIDAKKKGSKRRKLLIRSKQKQLRKLKNQMKDVEHKQSRALISILEAEGVQRLVIGDVRDIRQELDVGPTTNQKLHQWSFGSVRHKLTYKAERAGMHVALQEESYTSRTCPMCDHRRKRSPNGRVFTCTNKTCRWRGHRDAVGACNIRRKYLGLGPVVGVMAPPTGIRYVAGVRVAQGACSEKPPSL
jgi:putative transposase